MSNARPFHLFTAILAVGLLAGACTEKDRGVAAPESAARTNDVCDAAGASGLANGNRVGASPARTTNPANSADILSGQTAGARPTNC
jgi:hypothetical protein